MLTEETKNTFATAFDTELDRVRQLNYKAINNRYYACSWDTASGYELEVFKYECYMRGVERIKSCILHNMENIGFDDTFEYWSAEMRRWFLKVLVDVSCTARNQELSTYAESLMTDIERFGLYNHF